MIPLWAIFGFGAALASAMMMLTQEFANIRGFSLAFWNKVMCALVMIPFIVTIGLPEAPFFYMIVCGQAVLWVVSDVVLFNNIPQYGAGVISRILPLSVILTFISWFFFDATLLMQYMASPIRFIAIITILCATTFFAIRLRKCAVSWPAICASLPILFAATAGPILAKIALAQSDVDKGPYAFVFIEALTMVVIWACYYAIRKPVTHHDFFGTRTIKYGLLIGVITSVMVVCNLLSIYYSENPAYFSAIKLLSSVFILLAYYAIGRKDKGDLYAGFGVVLCAITLTLIVSL